MWVCNYCNSQFEDPSVHHYREDMNGEGAWQDFWENRCPYCGSEEVEETEEMDLNDFCTGSSVWIAARNEWVRI